MSSNVCNGRPWGDRFVWYYAFMNWVIGIDEVGRGPLAGPIGVSAVALPAHLNEWTHWEGLKDSKKLSEKRREAWFTQLRKREDLKIGIGMVGADYINTYGIVGAATEAVANAIAQVGLLSSDAHILLDRGLRAPEEWQQEQFTKGDEKIPVIALASIMAKVTRDRYMVELAATYPLYGFEKHKGYGTKVHQEAIRMHGPIQDVHRTLFIRGLTM